MKIDALSERADSRRDLRRSAIVMLLVMLNTASADEGRVTYNRNVAPILASHCYECHGPDEEHREAGLRLDDRSMAVARLDSGMRAIVPGSSAESELIRRILSHEDDRMPPMDTGNRLSAKEIQLLKRWIDTGAQWQGHWAYEPLEHGQVPKLQNDVWARNPIDRFILARLEQAGLTPAPPANRFTLIRRLYFDVTGLPPTASAISRFVDDGLPNAYESLVDVLLASPHCGERWGRHWLDVARYADSNGGDENHAYPLAHRYRDYVIQALNQDVTFDRFIRQQLAGDLMEVSDDEDLNAQRMTATGYLAIGMKILAEQDPVKKRADMIDEQIDTFGRTFLGLSLGCARCHDHKFDPIPTKDYYSLAGIFFSSNVKDQPLMSRDYQDQLAQHSAKKQAVQARIATIQSRFDDACASGITREAESFDRANVIVDNENYGKGIGIISDPSSQLNFAEYDLDIAEAGRYVVQLRYAAATPRPGKILVNSEVAKADAIAKTTGSWGPESQQWFTEGLVEFKAGLNVLRIESQPMMSHIDKIRLIDARHVSHGALDELDDLNAELANIEKQKPQPTLVMAVADENARNAKVHLRGSHLDLGAEVQRGFLEVLDGKNHAIPDSSSGRLELANWLTDNPVAARLTSRVIVNRLWHWHFGRGLVSTPDDFGIRGEPPTHPQLLDFLAARLIEENWSLKAIHRMILTSATFQMSTATKNSEASRVDPANQLYWKRDRIRLDAESIRDALLMHSGKLVIATGNSPITVKSQDPSPQDMQTNLEKYDGSLRRSVYLPIVRSNVYEFLTLFDFPNASSPVGKRNQTTIPTQALWLMNSPLIVKYAQAIAKFVDASEGDGAAIRQLYLKLYARDATAQEVTSGQEFLRQFRNTFTVVDPNSELAAWTSYCQVLLASNEYLYLN